MTAALVIGGDSLIGGALARALAARGWDVATTTRRADAARRPDRPFLDLAAPGAWPEPPDPPRLAFLCAGATGLAACRRDPETTRRINVDAPLALAARLADMGCRVVGLSTNLVFDGRRPAPRADDLPSPCTEYGRQKAALERGLIALGENGCVVRLTKVLAPGMPLIASWIAALDARRPVRPFRDLVMAPVDLRRVAEALARLAERPVHGVLQLSGEADVSYAEAAVGLARRLGVPEDLVEPTTAREAGVVLEAAPAHTRLDTAVAAAALGWTAPGLDAVLDEVCPG